ncbi:MAG: hypothetical protein FWH03_08355 [Firmicutes bacterium]|nr:hypothetical protein [Bacillota bacterium]
MCFINTTIMGFELTDPVLWIILSCIFITVLAVILITVFAVKANRSKRAGKKAGKVKVKGGVRYSVDNTIQFGNAVNVSHSKGDFTVVKGKTYTARVGGALIPGQYTLLTTAHGENKFNIRIGRFLREYTHGDSIVLAEGETIVCTSHSVLLR